MARGSSHAPTRSLRTRFAFWVNLIIGLPLLVYLLADTRVDRRRILDSRLEILESMADLLVDAALQDPDGGVVSAQALLDRFALQHPTLEILLLDEDARVLAATQPGRVGRAWDEPPIRRVLSGEAERSWGLADHDGIAVLDVTRAVGREADGSIAAVHLAEPQARLARETRQAALRGGAFVLVLLVLLSAMVIQVTDRVIIRRLGRITSGLRDTGWLGKEPADAAPGDELDALSRVLTEMMDRIDATTRELRGALAEREALVERVERFNEDLSAQVAATRRELEVAQETLIRQERLSTIGELTAGLAHEIRNPLQIIRATAETVRRRPEDVALLDDVIEEVTRMNRLVRELLDYARPLEFRPEPVDLGWLVDAAVGEVRRDAPSFDVTTGVAGGLQVAGDETLLRRVLVNLLRNAVEAGGPVEVQARTGEEGAVLEVLDRGPGVAEEDLPRVFEPFFSRKEAGVGMGLPLSRRIVDQHRGTLVLEPRNGGGTCARLVLPGA